MSKQPRQIKGNKKADCIRQDNQSASRTSHHNHTGDETMNSQIVPQTVIFNNQEILTFEQNGTHYTAMKPICENIGIDWRSQRQRILRDEVLSEGVVMITTPTNGGEQEMLSLPINYLNGWLFGIDVSRVKESAKELLIKYKKECYQALYNYWHNGIAVNPRRVTISVEQQKAIRSAVAKRCQSNSVHYQTVYTALYEHFNIPRYTELLAGDFDEALRFIRNVELTPAIEQPVIDYGQQNAFWKLVGILQYEEVSKTITLMEALIKQGVVQMEALKKQKALIWDSLAEQKHPIYDPVVRDGLLKQAQDFIARQNALKFA